MTLQVCSSSRQLLEHQAGQMCAHLVISGLRQLWLEYGINVQQYNYVDSNLSKSLAHSHNGGFDINFCQMTSDCSVF